jgi:hypothetical protein
MKVNAPSFRSNNGPQPILTAGWIVVATVVAIAVSLSLACATPLAAVAAVGGARMKPREGLSLVLTAWLANQVVGYGLLHYPRTWDSFAWGDAIGIASLLAALGARGTARMSYSLPLAPVAAFLVAFLIYEGTLLTATALLPSSDAVFSLPVILRIFKINACAVIGLTAIHWLAVKIGPQPRDYPKQVALSHG